MLRCLSRVLCLSRIAREYLLAEAWRRVEETEGAPTRDAEFEAQACAASPEFAKRVMVRATAFAESRELAKALVDAIRRGTLLAMGALVVAFAIGWGSLQLFPVDGGRLNVVALIVALVLPSLISLLLWLVVTLVGMRRLTISTGWLGDFAAHLITFSSRLATPNPTTKAVGHFLIESAGGRARLAMFTHGIWLGFLLGAWFGSWTWFAFKQVDFYWGTTVLSANVVESSLTVVTQPLARVGVEVPTPQQIHASRLGSTPSTEATLRQRWAYFVLASLALYGIAPRLLALIICGCLIRYFDNRLRLDLSEPGYVALRRFLDRAPPGKVIDPDLTHPHDLTPIRPQGTAALPRVATWLALERNLEPCVVPEVNLGVVSHRKRQQEIIELTRAATWQALVIQAAFEATPDRGLARFVQALVRAAKFPVYLAVISQGVQTDWTSRQRDERVEDWRALGISAGIDSARISIPDIAA